MEREISPAKNVSCEEYIELQPLNIKMEIERIRKEKGKRIRPLPSLTLIDSSKYLTATKRKALLDKIANLVDENLTGRSDMCRQFTNLLVKGL